MIIQLKLEKSLFFFLNNIIPPVRHEAKKQIKAIETNGPKVSITQLKPIIGSNVHLIKDRRYSWLDIILETGGE